MALNPALLENAIKAAVFGELQNQFLGDVPPEHQADVTDQHDKMATAVSKAAAEICNHITSFLEQPGSGVVSSVANTVVATAGSPVAQTGTGTGPANGTCTTPPGGFL